MKIYTKTGDKGQTSLIGGTRVSKSDKRLEAYGTVDELNSYIGIIATYEAIADQHTILETIQNKLFVVGSHLATDTNVTLMSKKSILSSADIELIEQQIDKMNLSLPELRAFILPGGSIESSFCHVCRTVSRRAERRIVDMSNEYHIDSEIIVYVNRLSDYFFTLARYASFKQGAKEILWKNVF